MRKSGLVLTVQVVNFLDMPIDPSTKIKYQINRSRILVLGMPLSTGKIYVKKLEGKVGSGEYNRPLR